MIRKVLVAACAVLFTIAPAGAVNLVANGGFETGDFTGWTQVGDTFFDGVACESFGGVSPPVGACQAFFGSVDPAGSGIVQTLTTVAGASYDISFLAANLGGPPNAFGVFWDGAFVALFFDNDPFPYSLLSGVLTASGTATDFALIFYNEPSYFLIDDISVQQIGVPEPATWGLMIVGFGLTGAALRRRKAVLAA